MIEKSIKTLEFNIIIQQLSNNADSESSKQKLLNLKPYLSQREVQAKTNDTTEARIILDQIGTVPLSTMKDLTLLLEFAEKGSKLAAEQLVHIDQILNSC